jgi:hypothetical protein
MLTRLVAAVLIASLSPMAQAAADDPNDLIARAQRLCDREHVVLVVTADASLGYTIQYLPDHDRIELNAAALYWHSQASRDHQWRVRHFSTRHPDHLVMHELAHAKLCRQVGVRQFYELLRLPISVDRARVAGLVSVYAGTSAAEFVAEVYVGLWCGLSYPPDVMTYYESLWRQE